MKQDDLADQNFVDHLEWQLRTEFRREERFAVQPQSIWRMRGWRAAAVVVVSILAGYAGATVAQNAAGQENRALLAAQNRIQLELAEQNLGLAEETLSRMQVGSNAGVVPEAQLAAARMQRAVMERQVAAMHLDVDEQRLTGVAPRHDLAAPLVDGRDFVSDRLRLQGENLQDQLAQATAESDRLAELVRRGVVEAPQLAMSEVAQTILDRELALTHRLVALRENFLAGSIDEAALQAREALQRARTDADNTALHTEMARSRFDRLSRAVGMPEAQVQQAEHALRMAELQEELSRLRVRLLRRVE